MSTELSDEYLRFNEQQTKNIAVVVDIDGVDLLSNRTIYTKIRYGDPGINYGTPGVVYGGLRKVQGVRSLLSLDGSSLTISQRLEPEQGKGAVSTLAMSFVDKDQYMTQVISPGVIVPEILGRSVKIYLGYEEISFPEDYLIIFRGKITQVDSMSGKISIQFSDPNFNRRQNVFYTAKTKLGTTLTPTDDTIPVLDNTDFHREILGPDGFYDTGRPWNPDGTLNIFATKRTGVRTFLKIDDEYLEYGPLGFGTNTFTNVLRGTRGTTAANHDIAAEVMGCVEITDHAIDMALKLMLSGWGGDWLSDVPIYSIVKTFDPILGDQANSVILPDKVDAIADYGLIEGDYVTITGSGVPANNDTFRIVRFADLSEQPNRIIYLTGPLTQEYPTSALLNFRSQFDTYPETCGVKMTPQDVDIAKHISLKNTFLSDTANSYRFFLTAQESCKNFIETEIYLPISAYSLTVRGQCSIGYTKPPLADEKLLFLDKSNILDPQNIKPMRGLNNRKFFNEVGFTYDYDDNGRATSTFRAVDFESLATIGVSSALPINSRGARTDLGTNTLFERRASFLFSRYKKGATLLDLKLNWKQACQIEAGDTVALKDNGDLQIANFATGERDLLTQLFEVQNRNLDIKSGQGTITLVSGIGADATDRYATISPSSVIVSGTTTYIIVEDSFGAIFPGDEERKWKDYLNEKIVIHDENYTVTYETTLQRIDPVNPYKFYVDALPVTPMAGWIMDIPPYPDTPNKRENALYKVIHAFFGPQVAVVSGASATQFDVGPSDIAKFYIGSKVIVHLDDYSVTSPEVSVINIIGNTIVVDEDLGFTPDNTYLIDGIGMPDQNGFYRYI